MRAAIRPSTSSSLTPLSPRRGMSGPSSQLGQVSSAVWISRWMCVKSFTLTTSWALSDSRMRRWVSCAAFIASSCIRADSPLASSRELSSSRIYTQARINQKLLFPHIDGPHYANRIVNLSTKCPSYLSKVVRQSKGVKENGQDDKLGQPKGQTGLGTTDNSSWKRAKGVRWRRKPDPSSTLGLIPFIDVFSIFYYYYYWWYDSFCLPGLVERGRQMFGLSASLKTITVTQIGITGKRRANNLDVLTAYANMQSK